MQNEQSLDKLNIIHSDTTFSSPLIPPSSSHSAILDSGCTNHYFPPNFPVKNIKPTSTGINVTLPDSSTIKSTHTASLPIPSLNDNATKVHIFPNLHSALLSVGQLCDSDCSVTFKQKNVCIYNSKNELITTGWRDPSSGMYKIPLPIHNPQTSNISFANGIIKRDTPISDLCQFIHASLFSPTISTLESAIKNGFLDSFPGITLKNIRKYLPPSIATSKGHMTQDKQGIMSTKKFAHPAEEPLDPKGERTHNFMTNILELPTGKGHTFSDQTGKFPCVSSRGYKYIFVMYDYDSNSILSEPIKNRSENELIRAFNKLHDFLLSKGCKPKFHKLDNECSAALQSALEMKQVKFQLAPPHLHRTNAAERAIRTFKDHLLAGLASVDPDFPMHLWDRLLHQATLTLNLLRRARINPNLSAYAFLNGSFNYMSTPLAPPGIRVEMHEKPANRPSFGYHSTSGFYIGPAINHYRCYKVYIPTTAHERIADTIAFFPARFRMPQTSALDQATQAADDLIDILKNPKPASPFLEFGSEQQNALKKLATLFKLSLPLQPKSTYPPLEHTPALPRVRNPPPSLPRVNVTPAPASPAINQPTSSFQQPHQYNTRLQRKIQQQTHQINHAVSSLNFMANPVLDVATGKMLEYRDLIKGKDKIVWERGMSNELGRLAQGVGDRMPHGTNTIKFIKYADMPKNKRPTYARIVSELRPQKPDPFRIRITAGGNLIVYLDDKSQPTSDIVTAKILLNSVVSTPNAKFLGLDIKNMYLHSGLPTPEYMRIPQALIPDEIIQQYQLQDYFHNGYLYCEIQKGLYGLPQAGKLAHDKLKAHLKKFDFLPCPITPGLWKHKIRDIVFCLVVDDFGVRYTKKDDADYLIQCLHEEYDLHEDWDGNLYIGMSLKWDYIARSVEISMPGYIEAALQRFSHPPPHKQQHSPFHWNKPTYGATIQYAPLEDSSPILSTKDTTRVQQVVGTLLYYARAIDNTMLPALNDIAADQSAPTQKTAQQLTQLLDYCVCHPDATIKFTASDMILHVHSDASYLSAPKSRSKVGGFFYLSSKPTNPKKPELDTVPLNGPVHVVAKRIRNVMASATEAETGALFYNGQEALPLIRALNEMGHPQPPTPIQTDNYTAYGIVNSSIRQRKSKAMDMRFYWVQDKCSQGDFVIFWKPGKDNLADYFTKHHSTSHHKQMRSIYLHTGACSNHITATEKFHLDSDWQGCVGPEFHPQPNRGRGTHIEWHPQPNRGRGAHHTVKPSLTQWETKDTRYKHFPLHSLIS